MATRLKESQLHELLYQALETELGGIQVYETAIECAVDDDLRDEWESYLEQTKNHREVLLDVFERLGLDPERTTPGRNVVEHIGRALVAAMKLALKSASPEAAELVATECVVLAETKDHHNWELIGLVADECDGLMKEPLKAAHDEVEVEEDHHLYHTKGWSRELWAKSLGLSCVLPPPEESKNVESAIEAARAEQARNRMM